MYNIWIALPKYKGNWGVKNLQIDHFVAGPMPAKDAKNFARALSLLRNAYFHIGLDPRSFDESAEQEKIEAEIKMIVKECGEEL